MVNQFLAQFAHELAPGVHAVMPWDQAGLHTAKAIIVPSTVTLMPPPPNSPELNSIENLWHYLRSHFWSNRNYPDYDAFMDAATQSWRQAALGAPTVKTVCAAPYIQSASN